MSDITGKAAEAKRSKVGRSPAYPGIPLKAALEKALALYDAEGKYAVPMASAFRAWGYSDKSSGGRDIRASLRYFGLISVDGDGENAKVRITEDALRVLLDQREDQTEKKTIIRRLALNPTAHKKLWTQFPEGIRSDATAAHFLLFDGGFSKSAAEALIAEFKETASFASLYEPSSMSVINSSVEAENDVVDEITENKEPTTAPVQQNQYTHQPPSVTVLAGERIAFIEESQPGQYLKLIACGAVDDSMLEALEDFVKRQRKRLRAQELHPAFRVQPASMKDDNRSEED